MSARVLVVDDILPNVKLLIAKLQHEYFDGLAAYSGEEALRRAREDAPDVVLLDVMMPGMDGFEVCRRLKEDPQTAHIPVVMVTALSDQSDRLRGLEAGADDFLTKPVDDTALFARVRSLTRLKMMMDEWLLRESVSGRLGVLPTQELAGAQSATEARVLLLEDDSLEADKIATTLAEDDDSVTALGTAGDPVQVVNSAEAVPELIIVALTGAVDGLRLVGQLRSNERSRNIPILLLGEESDFARTVKGLELGANDYIQKPFDAQEMLARVRTQVRRRRYQELLRSNHQTSMNMALTDSLTGLFNRRYLETHLGQQVERMARTRKRVAILLLDIDKFKPINDTHGHLVGDTILKEFAERIANRLRNFDLVGRLGGEEFVVVIPDATIHAAQRVAERLRASIGDRPFQAGDDVGALPITVSIGVALGRPEGDSVRAMIERADRALYEAKHQGRNCIAFDEADVSMARTDADDSADQPGRDS